MAIGGGYPPASKHSVNRTASDAAAAISRWARCAAPAQKMDLCSPTATARSHRENSGAGTSGRSRSRSPCRLLRQVAPTPTSPLRRAPATTPQISTRTRTRIMCAERWRRSTRFSAHGAGAPWCERPVGTRMLAWGPFMGSFGAGSRNRTHDQRFTKPLLYQLSYAGPAGILPAPGCWLENHPACGFAVSALRARRQQKWHNHARLPSSYRQPEQGTEAPSPHPTIRRCFCRSGPAASLPTLPSPLPP